MNLTKVKCKSCKVSFLRETNHASLCSEECLEKHKLKHRTAGALTLRGIVRKTSEGLVDQKQAKLLKKQIRLRKKADKKPKLNRRPSEAADFYLSRAWRDLRFEAFLKYGRKCLCCGARPPQVVLHVDHVKPRATHPHLELQLSNLQILCADCNLGKSARYDTDFRKG